MGLTPLFLGFQVAYKADYKHDVVDYNYLATATPFYQTTMRLVPLKDVSPPPTLHSMTCCGVRFRQRDGKEKNLINIQEIKGGRNGAHPSSGTSMNA